MHAFVKIFEMLLKAEYVHVAYRMYNTNTNDFSLVSIKFVKLSN